MSKIKIVFNRVTGRPQEVTAGLIRNIRQFAKKAEVTQPEFKLRLPYDAPSINRIFFYQKPVTEADLLPPYSVPEAAPAQTDISTELPVKKIVAKASKTPAKPKAPARKTLALATV